MQVLERFFLNFMNFVGITGRPKGRISAANDERRNIKRPRRIVFQDWGDMCCSVSHRPTAISYVPLGFFSRSRIFASFYVLWMHLGNGAHKCRFACIAWEILLKCQGEFGGLQTGHTSQVIFGSKIPIKHFV